MKRLGSWCALLVLPAAAMAVEPDSEAQFRADMISLLSKVQPGKSFVAGKEPLVITVDPGKGDDERIINLHRIYGYCTATETTAADCKVSKEEFAQKITLDAPKATSVSLRVIVRDRQYVAYLEQVERGSEKPVTMAYRRPIGDDLFALLASDGPDTIAMVGSTGLSDLNLSEAEAWAIADRQTRAIVPPMPDGVKLRKEATAFQDYPYASSLLADLERWRPVAAATGDDLFMTVVSDHFVMVGSMPDGEGLEKFRATVAEDCAAQQRCISPNIYRFRGGRWMIAPASKNTR